MSGGPVQRAGVHVDLGAVERNCARIVRELGDGTALCAVVKADGYGHGARECAAAARAGGATWLAVATASEAWELRQAFSDVPILTMGALTGAEMDVALHAGSEVAVWSREFLDAVARRGAEFGLSPRIHVKYDTGMGRLGERDPDAVRDLVRACAEDERLALAGLWTHFATADEPDGSFMEAQLERFLELARPLVDEHPSLMLHAANSAATLRDPATHLDMVRCGVAIYDLDPFQEAAAARGLEPALELRTYVAAVKRFEPGTSAGYGRTWSAASETFVGVLPIGYGDGVRRALGNRADVLVGARRAPIVGTISMDNLTVDLGPETEVQVGDPAILIGAQGEERVDAEDLARRLETINYEITCGISPRVPRSHSR